MILSLGGSGMPCIPCGGLSERDQESTASGDSALGFGGDGIQRLN